MGGKFVRRSSARLGVTFVWMGSPVKLVIQRTQILERSLFRLRMSVSSLERLKEFGGILKVNYKRNVEMGNYLSKMERTVMMGIWIQEMGVGVTVRLRKGRLVQDIWLKSIWRIITRPTSVWPKLLLNSRKRIQSIWSISWVLARRWVLTRRVLIRISGFSWN